MSTTRLLAWSACALASLSVAPAIAAGASASGRQELDSQSRPGEDGGGLAAATLEQCLTAPQQSERSATFAGAMTAIAHSVRLAMRIEIQERRPAEAQFHTVSAPGLGAWRESDPGVKAYRYVKQVTNLSAPALYRALVRFRWLGADGRSIRRLERHTATCLQSAPALAASGRR